jgi:hypothetical protein
MTHPEPETAHPGVHTEFASAENISEEDAELVALEARKQDAERAATEAR